MESGFDAFYMEDGNKKGKPKTCLNDRVIMNIVMPWVTWINIVKGIITDFPDAKIFMCSAIVQKTMVTEALEAGARDFIIKLFQKDRVKEAVSKIIGTGAS